MDPDPDPGGPKHTDPTDSDPQHWFKVSKPRIQSVWCGPDYSKDKKRLFPASKIVCAENLFDLQYELQESFILGLG